MNSYLLFIEHDGASALNAINHVAEIGVINMQLFTVRSEKDGQELVQMMESSVGELPEYLIAKVSDGLYGYRGGGRLVSAVKLLRA